MPDPTQLTGAQWIAVVMVGLILVGLQTYVAAKAKNAATQQDIEDLTREVEGIKADYARELERLKSTLLKEVEAHRIQYETELQTYKEIWAAAYEVFSAVNGLRRVHGKSTQEELQQAHDAKVAYLRAAIAYEGVLWKHRPFFPIELCTRLMELGGLLGAAFSQSHQTEITPPGALFHVWQPVGRAIRAYAPPLRSMIPLGYLNNCLSSRRIASIRPTVSFRARY